MKFLYHLTTYLSQRNGLSRVNVDRIGFGHIVLRSMITLLSLAVVFLLLSLVTLENSTAKTIITPISSPAATNKPPVFSIPIQLQPADLKASNPLATAFINAVPGSDGKEVFVSVAGVRAAGSPVFLNIDPGSGPSGHQDSRAMPLSGTTYIATAIGFAPGVDIGNDNDDTMEITTTVGSEVMSTGEIKFHRAFVEASKPETILVDDNKFNVDMPNTNTLPVAEAYVLVMATHAPPASLPPGYDFASSAYQVNPSGALTQSERFMTLKLTYQEPLPHNSDPHTLAVMGWDRVNEVWNVLGGDLFDDTGHLTYATKRFGIYALATAPIWRDSFKESSLTGISDRFNTQGGPGDTIILSTGATSGSVTSIPIIPPEGAASWGTFHFSATTSANTDLTVDILALNDTVVLANVGDGADLDAAGLSLATYPSLKLRATLTSTMTGETPALNEWLLGWLPAAMKKVYLPVILRDNSP